MQKLKRFWFVLLEDKKQVAFVYYKNEDAYIARQRNVGFIKIDNSRINVVGEYLTHKNAFQIVTEKSEYTFVSETRSVYRALATVGVELDSQSVFEDARFVYLL